MPPRPLRPKPSPNPSYPRLDRGARWFVAGVGAAMLLGTTAPEGCGGPEELLLQRPRPQRLIKPAADAGQAPDAGDFFMGDVASPDPDPGVP